MRSVVIDYLQHSIQKETLQTPTTKIGFAYLYCDHANQIKQTNIGLVSSLARQLIESHLYDEPNSLFQVAKNFYLKFEGRSLGHNDYDELLRELIFSLDKTFIVIDALDECAEVDKGYIATREKLIKTLSSLPVQLMVTSRNYVAIRDLLRGATMIDIQPDINHIKCYVYWRIFDETHGSPDLSELVNLDPTLVDEITTTVIDRYRHM